MKKTVCIFITIIVILSVSACSHQKTDTENKSVASSQELYINTLESTVKEWANAYYRNDPKTYVNCSIYNPLCMTALGVSDYNYDEKYNDTKKELSDYIAYMEEQYEFYYVEAAPSDYEIYDKSSEMFDQYIKNISKDYKKTDTIDAFALVEIQIKLEYTENSSNASSTEESNVECMLIDGTWYVIL